MPKEIENSKQIFIYKPTINSRSNEIALNLSSRKHPKKIFEKLYLESKELKNKLELLSKKNQAHESKGISECTFKPSINKSLSSNKLSESLFLRTTKWKENIEKKMENEKTKSNRKINAECTFNPSTKRLEIRDNDKFKFSYPDKNQNKYFLRLTSLKKFKEEDQDSINQLPGMTKIKKKNFTKPKEFVFCTSERNDKRLKK